VLQCVAMSALWLDLRYAIRMMVKGPGLTAILVVTLALGIGASTTIFSVVNSVVLRSLPYDQPDQLVRVYTEFRNNQTSLPKHWVSPPEYFDLKEACRTCAATGGWTRGKASLSGGDRPMRVDAAYATHTLLPLLGVKPLIGRFFDEKEDQPGDPAVVILGYGIWKRAFGGDHGVIGKKITLDAIPVTIIGVMPEGFDFLDRVEAWVPLNFEWANGRAYHLLNVLVRLQPDVSFEAFEDELIALTEHWARSHGPNGHSLSPDIPGTPSHPMIAVPFHQDLVGSLSTTLWLLQGAVLLVLLIAIVNVANLLLARSENRTREVAVRHALGASRRRLMRQFVTESVVLGMLGGALGVLVAVWAVDGITALIPKSAPRAGEITLDATAVAFAVACSIGASLLFGIAPILHARKSDLHGALKDGSPRMSASKARLRARRGLVIAEIAFAVVLVIGCTVMVRSFLRLQQVDVGFKPDHLLTFEIEVPAETYPGVTSAVFWQRLVDRVRALPGVEHAALIDGLPYRRLRAWDINLPGRTPKPSDPMWKLDYWQSISDDALETLGARLVKGRTLLKSDTVDSPLVVLVNEAFVAKFFPGMDPIGQKVQMVGGRDTDPMQTVVGVFADIKQAGLDKPAGTELLISVAQYQALWQRENQHSPGSLYMAVRAVGDPEALIPVIHRAVADLDPTLPISHMRTMDDVLWEAVARPRFLTFLLTCFAGLALLLAAVGIYGVMSHTVAQRTHEIGLRVALGAQPAQVRAMILRQAGVLVAAGVAIGLGGTIALQLVLDASLQGLFYGAPLSQPPLLGGVAVAVALTALLATWVPARRATKVEPNVALRSE
jgi:putative ABC transport system permease protein